MEFVAKDLGKKKARLILSVVNAENGDLLKERTGGLDFGSLSCARIHGR